MSKIAEIREKAESYRDKTARNLSEMVKIPSLSCEEDLVIQEIARQCREAGFDEVRVDGLGNLIGRVGHGPKILAIDAHIDTVDVGERSLWDFDPFSGEIKDGFVLGRGSADQEGGAAAMVTAGRILKELNYDGEYSVYFTFTVMEEDCDGMCWNYLIEKEKLVPDFAVSTEPTNLNIYRGHRGRMEFEIRFHGVSCHGSEPERGDNAIYKASRFALEVEKLHTRLKTDEFLGKGSVTASLCESSSPSLCSVSDYCRLYLDRRLTWGETKETATAELAEFLPEGAEITIPVYERPSYKGTVFTQEKYFPTWKIPENHLLVQAGAAGYRALFEAEPKIDKWTFSTNGVAICGKHGIPVIGFGPGNEVLAHAPNEKTPVAHLEKASAFYAALPYMLEKGGK